MQEVWKSKDYAKWLIKQGVPENERVLVELHPISRAPVSILQKNITNAQYSEVYHDIKSNRRKCMLSYFKLREGDYSVTY